VARSGNEVRKPALIPPIRRLCTNGLWPAEALLTEFMQELPGLLEVWRLVPLGEPGIGCHQHL
jgi:hypothetical protein